MSVFVDKPFEFLELISIINFYNKNKTHVKNYQKTNQKNHALVFDF